MLPFIYFICPERETVVWPYLELKTDNNKYCRNKINETEIKLEELQLEKEYSC